MLLGIGTVGVFAKMLRRRCTLIEVNPGIAARAQQGIAAAPEYGSGAANQLLGQWLPDDAGEEADDEVTTLRKQLVFAQLKIDALAEVTRLLARPGG